jgi:hypothetical protein
MADTMTTPEQANFLAAKVVACATAFLDGRHCAAHLAADADRLQCELLTAASDPDSICILVPARLLVIAMAITARAKDEARLDRCQAVMGALVELARHESTDMRLRGVQRS